MTSAHIVGMGLAGSLVAWELLQRGIRVTAWDDTPGDTSSTVAAGMITPITGQRLKPTWRGPELVSIAMDLYHEVEQRYGLVVRRDWSLRRVFRNADMQAWFHRRYNDVEFAAYDVRAIQPGIVDEVPYPFGGMMHDQVFTIDIRTLMSAIRSSVEWCEIPSSADIMIDCTGYRALGDPLWSWLPIEPSKGEILDVVIPGFEIEYILTNGTWILPLGEQRYRIGATHDWDDHDPRPTDAARESLLEAVRPMIAHEIIVTDHRAALRPSTKFKRPLVGQHPQQRNRFTLNGLGTKGALQGPLAAQQLVSLILDGIEPDEEMNIRRWYP